VREEIYVRRTIQFLHDFIIKEAQSGSMTIFNGYGFGNLKINGSKGTWIRNTLVGHEEGRKGKEKGRKGKENEKRGSKRIK
jgi:hypothetical protein